MRYLLVDRITETTPRAAGAATRAGIKGWKTVAMTEDYLAWHFPGQPILPGSLVLEACVQLAGWLEASASDFQQWFLLDRVVSARYFGFSGPGDRVELAVEEIDPAPVVASGPSSGTTSNAPRRAFRAEAAVAGERRALLEFEGVTTALEDLDDRERMRRTWKALRGERPARDARGRA